jgi:hypothetical protein
MGRPLTGRSRSLTRFGLVPRDWRTLNAIHDAKKKMLSVYCKFPHGRSSSKPYRFNGSETNRRNKRRPITLAPSQGDDWRPNIERRTN